MVQKGDGPMTLTCERKGFKKTVHKFDETFQGATLGNILLGGGIGIIVDAASGAAQVYPNEVKLVMEPEDCASKEEMDKYVRLKKELAEEAKKKKEEEGFAEDTETTDKPKPVAVASKAPKPSAPVKCPPTAEAKVSISEEKPVNQEVASLPAPTKSPAKPTPNWSAFQNERDYYRVEGFGTKAPVSIALHKNTRGKVTRVNAGYPFDMPISNVSFRLIKSIKKNLDLLSHKKSNPINISSPQKLLVVVKVSEWEFEISDRPANGLDFTFLTKIKIKEIDEKGRAVLRDQFQIDDWVRHENPIDVKEVRNLVDETALKIAKKLIERHEF